MTQLWSNSMLVILLLAGLGGLWLLVRRALHAPDQQGSAIERILASSGAVCCMETITLLRALTQRGDAQEFAEVWMRISLHLERALPQTPPALRGLLRKQLEAAAQRCSLRSVAKAMSDCAARC